MRYLAALIPVLLTVVACSGPKSLDEIQCAEEGISISPDFTPAEVEQIMQAGDNWNKFAGRTLAKFHIGEGDQCAIRRINDEPTYLQFRDSDIRKGDKSNFIGYTAGSRLHDGYKNMIWLVPFGMHQNLDGHEMVSVSEHEIGHLFGLNHVCPGVMCPGADSHEAWLTEFTPEDLRECQAERICP